MEGSEALGLRRRLSLLESTALHGQLLAVDVSLAARFAASIERARSELEAPTVDVVFVGTFSSGKSTLINALIGRYELQTGLRPTTQDVVAVLADVNSPHAGIQFVDTPGFNSEQPEHGEKARSALARADLIVVVCEPRGMSEDLRGFMEHVAAAKRDVAVVVNRLDDVDERAEVVEILERTRRSVASCGLPHAAVLACCARDRHSEETGVYGVNEVRRWLALAVANGRASLVERNLQADIDTALAEVLQRIERERTNATAQLASLNHELKAIENENVAGMVRSAVAEEVARAKTERDATKHALLDALSDAREGLERWIATTTGISDSNRVRRECELRFGIMRSHLSTRCSALAQSLQASASLSSQRAHELLRARVPDLVDTVNLHLEAVDRTWSLELPEATSADGAFIGAGAVAAGVGMLIGGPIGALLGAGAVAVFKGLFGDSDADLREKYQAAVSEECEQLIDIATQEVGKMWAAYTRATKALTRRVLSQYDSAINAARASVQAAATALDEKSADLEKLLQRLSRLGRTDSTWREPSGGDPHAEQSRAP